MASSSTPWYSPLTLDMLVRVLRTSLFHPFVMWMVPLCLRAQITPFSHPSFIISTAYATFLTLSWILSQWDQRIAFGPPRDVDLDEEVIVITGGASGLGLLVAEVYGLRGANVVVLDVEEPEGWERKGLAFYRCDVGDWGEVQRAAGMIEKEVGTPTMLINNAAVAHGKPLLELTTEEIERTIRTNLISNFHTIRTFLPGMLRTDRGTIVTTTSVLAHLGSSHLSDYAASKAGLVALHSSLCAELAASTHQSAKNIRTVLVTPGQMSTPLFGGVGTPAPFLAPVVEPVEVAKEIIGLLDRGEGGEVVAPVYVGFVGWWGVLWPGVRRVLREWSGIDAAIGGSGGLRAIKKSSAEVKE